MQPSDSERAASLDLAGDVGVVERALRLQRNNGCLGLTPVTILDRRLLRAQPGGVHVFLLAVIAREVAHPVASEGRRVHPSSARATMTGLYHHIAAPASALVSPSGAVAGRSREPSSAASPRRLTKSNAADCRSRGRGTSTAMCSKIRPGR